MIINVGGHDIQIRSDSGDDSYTNRRHDGEIVISYKDGILQFDVYHWSQAFPNWSTKTLLRKCFPFLQKNELICVGIVRQWVAYQYFGDVEKITYLRMKGYL